MQKSLNRTFSGIKTELTKTLLESWFFYSFFSGSTKSWITTIITMSTDSLLLINVENWKKNIVKQQHNAIGMLPFDKLFCTIRKVSNPDPNIHILCKNKGRYFHHSSHHCQNHTAPGSNNRRTNRRPENKDFFSAMFCLLAASLCIGTLTYLIKEQANTWGPNFLKKAPWKQRNGLQKCEKC